jgi:hypothetical protein
LLLRERSGVVDTILLKERLHEAVDQIVGEFSSAQAAPAAASTQSGDVEMLGSVGPFVFHWPADYGSENFDSGTAYRLAVLDDQSSVIVGWTTRQAWGRDRRRAVVFHRMRALDDPRRWYPWTEFVETDSGGYGASIPNPDRPRGILRDGAVLPARFTGRTTARADEAFEPVRNGASLRLIVDDSEEEEMVRHGHWVATLRRRI